ncbi:uncharacterized protein F4822DRAFT_407890 [Hypoxylon trugodes]|uniref:uncharacterized protein n=1 Tax=Hypoxylon trugodes TaxID=326681 RepID=UPI00219861BF|nr:uncharacterized protein F4822DRAFT_407890 [Hypoxylon trugodes]KAI1387893.1 hypothetical protein F4822DRAFT_407890 [Hypoxylon trugodes]
MSSNNGEDPSFKDSFDDNTYRTTYPPWPGVEPAKQAQIERNFFEDGVTIHFERIPQRKSWNPFLLGRGSLTSDYVIFKTVQASKFAKRRLSASEVDGTSEAAAISAYFFTWINPVSLCVTIPFTWMNREKFRFPFYTPGPRFNPQVFPFASLPIVKGAKATYLWHALRYCAFYVPAMFASTVFFGSMAENMYEVRISRDPRLQRLVQDFRKRVEDARARAMGSGQQQTLPQRPAQNASQSSPDQYPSEPESQTFQGYERDAYAGQSSTPQSSWSQNTQPQPQTQTPSPQVARYPEPTSRNTDDVSDLLDDDDDASPVSAASRRAEAQLARDAQSGSSWDRIRKQSQSPAPQWTQGDSSDQERGWSQLRQDKTQNSRENQPKSEGFAYTKQDEEKEKRNYEREQAQKEFDALLESERRGGSGRR